MNFKYKHIKNLSWLYIVSALLLMVSVSCDEDDEKEVGDLPDLTPPSAEFVSNQKEGGTVSDDFRTVFFTNQSISSTDFKWEVPENVEVLNDAPEVEEDQTPKTELEAKDLILKFPDFGTYEITLTASDKNNVESKLTKQVEVVKPDLDAPEPDFTFSTIGDNLKILTFVNTSKKSARIEWILPEEGSFVESTTAISDTAKVEFTADGTYDISLKAYNLVDDSAEATKAVEVNSVIPAPVPDFTFAVIGSNNRILTFENTSTNSTRIEWVLPTEGSFVEGTTATSDIAKVEFTADGTYDVTLKAFNSADDTEMITKSVEVDSSIIPAAIPNFTFVVSPTNSRVFTLENTSQNSTRIEWMLPAEGSFINGTTTTSDIAEVEFTVAGTYDVTLTAFNSIDESVMITKQVEVVVSAVPQPVILNPTFSEYDITVSGSSPCSCLKWVNTDFGGKAGSASGSGSQDATVLSPINNKEYGGIKFDDKSSTARVAYQKIDVTTGASYTIKFYTRFKKPGSTDTKIDKIEFRILDGSVAAKADINAMNTIANQLIEDPTVTPASTSDGSWVQNEVVFTATSSSIGIYVTLADPSGADVTADIIVDNFTISVNP